MSGFPPTLRGRLLPDIVRLPPSDRNIAMFKFFLQRLHNFLLV